MRHDLEGRSSMTPEQLWAAAQFVWKVFTSIAGWVASWFKRDPGRRAMVAIPNKTLIIMNAPRPRPLWWVAASMEGRAVVQVCCDLQATNISNMGVRLSAFKITK